MILWLINSLSTKLVSRHPPPPPQGFYSVVVRGISKIVIHFLNSNDLVYMSYKKNTMEYYEN
jgi:hypothetical protein